VGARERQIGDRVAQVVWQHFHGLIVDDDSCRLIHIEVVPDPEPARLWLHRVYGGATSGSMRSATA
jgi:hypothetical protein